MIKITLKFRWLAGGGVTINASLVCKESGPVLLRNPIVLCDFSGGVGQDPRPPLDPRMYIAKLELKFALPVPCSKPRVYYTILNQKWTSESLHCYM